MLKQLVFNFFLLLIFWCLTIIDKAKAQAPGSISGSVTIASPNAAALGKYGDYPVGYNTGVPDINIPIYTIKEGQLSLPISLSYHASGLKVMEPASLVGAGWSLNAGGMITRTVIGAPDDRGYLTNTLKGHFSDYGYNDYLFEPGRNNTGGGSCYDFPEGNNVIIDDISFTRGQKDGEPDLFFFNFGSYSGKFYFRDDRTPVIVPEADFKIEPVLSASLMFNGFIITTPDGIKYYFGKNQLADGNVDAIETTDPYTAQSGSGTGIVNSAWYLNRIISADNQFSINLIYVSEQYSYYTISMFPITDGDLQEKHCTLVKNFLNGVRLSKIDFSNGNIQFNLGSVRSDLGDYQNTSMFDIVNTNSKTLGSVTISDNANFCKKYRFYYSYFQDNTSVLPSILQSSPITTDTKRLKLDSIGQQSCDNSLLIPSYVFDYAKPDGSPNYFAPRRLSFAQDHWGFYNGADNNITLIPSYTVNDFTTYARANRESHWPEMGYGSLNKINYPTGGYTKFVFEPNEVWAKYTYYDSSLSGSAGIGPGIGQSQTQNISLNASVNSYKYVLRYHADGNSTGIAYFAGMSVDKNNPYKEKIFIPGTGVHSYDLTESGMSVNTTEYAEASIYEEIPKTYLANKPVGGERIQSISIYGISNNLATTTNYNYETAGQSEGILYSIPTYIRILRNDLIRDVGYATTNICSPNGCIYCDAGLSYTLSPSSLRPMETMQGNHIGYNRVEVSQSGNGKSVYQFEGALRTVPMNDVSVHSVNLSSCSNSIPNYPDAPLPFDFQRGNLKYESHTDESGNPLKTISYSSKYTENPVTTPCYLTKQGGPNSGIGLLTLYNLSTSKKDRTVIVTDEFSSTGAVLTIVDSEFYESPYHHQVTRKVTINSKGEKIENKIKYAFDYRISACDAISDCYSNYLSSYTTAFNNYNYALTYCINTNGCNCRWPAFQSYRYYWSVARKNYVACRRSNFTDIINAYQTAHDNVKSSANSDLKPILQMQDDFINDPIETTVWKNNKLISAQFIKDTLALPGIVYPKRMQQINLAAPSSAFTNSSVNGNGLIKDNRYQDETLVNYRNGNIHDATPKTGITTSYIWDYNNDLAVASVINVLPTDTIAYTSFESNNVGNWNISNTNRISGDGVTGYQYYQLSNGAISKSGLTPGKKYVVSYWTQNTSSLIINSTTGVKGGTISGWTFYLHTITLSGNVITIPVTSAAIDELRLYPVGAQMTTYTYSPLVGITSQCDINNRITNYEYDGLGRLNLVRDLDGNIIKKYQYAYQSPNPDNGTACSNTNCAAVDEKCINGFCEKAKRFNTSTVLLSSGPNAGKWKCSFYYQWSTGDRTASDVEFNSIPCDINVP